MGVAERLNGMFAFAVWDERDQRLVLIRDRLGVTPLYYHQTPGGVLFGSEPKAILANPLVRRVVDTDGLRGCSGSSRATPAAASTECSTSTSRSCDSTDCSPVPPVIINGGKP